ncbi:MAG: YdcF family protein [Bacteroidota bacterium]
MKVKFLISLLIVILLSSCIVNKIAYRQEHIVTKNEVFDVVIVPGFPYFENSNNEVLKMRILWANQLYLSGKTKHIVFTGSAVSTHYNEAMVMKKIAVELGIPDSVIYTEKKAEHSTENIYFAMQVCEQHNFTKVALATDIAQTSFLKKYIDTYFPYIARLPINYSRIDMRKDISIVNVEECKVENFVSLKNRKTKEQIALASKGNNIDTTGYFIMNNRFAAINIK